MNCDKNEKYRTLPLREVLILLRSKWHVGWLLREMGKRCDMECLRHFLSEYATGMPRTALRYAIERMYKEEREFWMNYPKKRE